MLTITPAALIAIVDGHDVPAREQMEKTSDYLTGDVNVRCARRDCAWYIVLVWIIEVLLRWQLGQVVLVHFCVGY
jgi:hypothetical protein